MEKEAVKVRVVVALRDVPASDVERLRGLAARVHAGFVDEADADAGVVIVRSAEEAGAVLTRLERAASLEGEEPHAQMIALLWRAVLSLPKGHPARGVLTRMTEAIGINSFDMDEAVRVRDALRSDDADKRAAEALSEALELWLTFMVRHDGGIPGSPVYRWLRERERAVAAAGPPQTIGAPSFLPYVPEGAVFEVVATLTFDNRPIRDVGFQVGDRVTFESAPVGWIAYSTQKRAAPVDPWQFVRLVAAPSQPSQPATEAKPSELYPTVTHPTAAARAGCPGGPIAWSERTTGYVCYYCRSTWSECVGIAKRGKALHAKCSKGAADVLVLLDPLRAYLACSDCGQAWAPFPLRDQSEACKEAAVRAREGVFQRDPLAPPGVGYARAAQARVAMCASFGSFVHGDEGLGCWRCGADRQAHS